jgi:hypothetical protein
MSDEEPREANAPVCRSGAILLVVDGIEMFISYGCIAFF